MTSKEPTADFADFADEGDAVQRSRWRAEVAWTGQRHACRHSLRLFLIHVIRGQIQPSGGGDVSSPPPRPSLPPRPVPSPGLVGTRFTVPVLPLNIRDLVEQVPTQSLPRPRNPKLSGTRRPSPHPDPPLLRGRRRLVAVAPLATEDLLGRDVPAPTRSINYFGVGDVPSPASHALATPLISSGLSLPFPNPSSKP